MKCCHTALPSEHIARRCSTPLGVRADHARVFPGIYGHSRAHRKKHVLHFWPHDNEWCHWPNFFNFLQFDHDLSSNMDRKLKRTEHEGYVAWSDLELDAVFGDYTDMELRRSFSRWDLDVAVDLEPVPKKPWTPKHHKNLCPVCVSGKRTITGFRGYMRRKHNRTYGKFWHFLICQISEFHKRFLCWFRLIFSSIFCVCISIYFFCLISAIIDHKTSSRGHPLATAAALGEVYKKCVTNAFAFHHAGRQAEPCKFCPQCWPYPGSRACVAQAGHLHLPPASL